jgi:phasin protein
MAKAKKKAVKSVVNKVKKKVVAKKVVAKRVTRKTAVKKGEEKVTVKKKNTRKQPQAPHSVIGLCGKHVASWKAVSNHLVDSSQKIVEKNMQMSKHLVDCGSFEELMKWNKKMFEYNANSVSAEMNKISELIAESMNEGACCISSQAFDSMSKMMKNMPNTRKCC